MAQDNSTGTSGSDNTNVLLIYEHVYMFINSNIVHYCGFFKHFVTMAGGSLAMPFLLFSAVCIEETDVARGGIYQC
jgi:hypothetical protein